MIYEIFSIKDVVSGYFTELKLFNNTAMAVRYFDGLCSESKIKNDLQLYRLGKFDISTGNIIPECEFIKGGSDCE